MDTLLPLLLVLSIPQGVFAAVQPDQIVTAFGQAREDLAAARRERAAADDEGATKLACSMHPCTIKHRSPRRECQAVDRFGETWTGRDRDADDLAKLAALDHCRNGGLFLSASKAPRSCRVQPDSCRTVRR